MRLLAFFVDFGSELAGGVTTGCGSATFTGSSTAGATTTGRAGTTGSGTTGAAVSCDMCIHTATATPNISPTPRLTSATHERERGLIGTGTGTDTGTAARSPIPGVRGDISGSDAITCIGAGAVRPINAPLWIARVGRSSAAPGRSCERPVTGRAAAIGADAPPCRACTGCGACSLFAVTGRAFTVPSAMAKSGLLAMTRSLAVEWGPHGIRLVAIAPGPFPTDGSNRQLNPGERAASVARAPLNPLGRVGQPLELANLAAYLLSPQAAYINGEMVTIDGGAHLRTSGAEDLLNWPPDKWAAMRSARQSG